MAVMHKLFGILSLAFATWIGYTYFLALDAFVHVIAFLALLINLCGALLWLCSVI